MINLSAELSQYIGLSFTLFFFGFVIVLTKKNILVVLMGIELMLNAVNIVFVSSSVFRHDLEGQVVAFFNVSLMAAEAGVGLALVTLVYKLHGDVLFDFFKRMKG